MTTYGILCCCQKIATENGVVKVTIKIRKSNIPEYEVVEGDRELFIESFPPAFKSLESNGKYEEAKEIDHEEADILTLRGINSNAGVKNSGVKNKNSVKAADPKQ